MAYDREEVEQDDNLLSKIKEDVQSWYTYWQENNTAGRNDRIFLFGEQWTAEEKEINRKLGKSNLQFNKLYPLYKSQIAEQRKNTANFKVRPKQSIKQTSQEEQEIREDLLRAICYDQKNDIVWQKTFESQLQIGYGAIRVSTDYVSAATFDQKIELEYFDNAEVCFFDMCAKVEDKSDGEFAGCYYDYARREFELMYPDHGEMRFDQTIASVGIEGEEDSYQWGDDKRVRVVEYFRKKHKKRMLYLIDGPEGISVFKEDYDKALKEKVDEILSMGLGEDELSYALTMLEKRTKIKAKRKVDDVSIERIVCTRDEILERSTFPSQYLPIVFVDGDSYFDRGRQYTQSFIKHAKDPQRLANYLALEIASAVKTRRRERYITTPEQIKGHENQWRNPEIQLGALLANYDSRGNLPQPVPTGEIPQTLLIQYQAAEQEIQTVLGIYEAFQGQESNERSGRAINARARQSSNSTFVYFDNLNRGIEQVGRIILDIMPKIYDTTRIVTLRDANGNTRDITLNIPIYDDVFENQLQEGEWDLEVTAGANYEVQKQEALQILLQLAQVSPAVFPLIADIVGGNIDIRNQGQLVDRLQHLVPEDIIAEEKHEQPKPKLPSPEEQMMQMEFQVKQKELELKSKEIETKEFETEVDRIEALTKLQELPLKAQEADQKAQAENFRTAAELQKTIVKARADAIKHAAMLEKGTASQSKQRSENR